MKHFIHQFIAFFKDILGLIYPIVFQFEYQHFHNEIKKEKKKKNLKILGNGPSLTTINNEKNKDEYDYCTVNFSIITDLFLEIQPQMHVFSDHYFFERKDEDKVKLVWERLKTINWPIKLFVPYTFPKWFINMVENNKNIKVFRFCHCTWEPELKLFKRLKLRFYDKGLLAPRNQNVMIPSIYVGILSGYKKILLLGVEHSWLKNTIVNDNNELELIDEHFYGKKSVKWYHLNGELMHLHELLGRFSTTFKNYWYLREFADYLGDIEIINCTKGSYIDAFERLKDTNKA